MSLSFLNGGNNLPFPGERDERIPSPKGIPFEQVPELSLAEVSAHVIEGIHAKYDLIVTNFANGDVIGHTANTQAKIKCAAVVDLHLGEVVDEAVRCRVCGDGHRRPRQPGGIDHS